MTQRFKLFRNEHAYILQPYDDNRFVYVGAREEGWQKAMNQADLIIGVLAKGVLLQAVATGIREKLWLADNQCPECQWPKSLDENRESFPGGGISWHTTCNHCDFEWADSA